jgi:hypothetical protein
MKNEELPVSNFKVKPAVRDLSTTQSGCDPTPLNEWISDPRIAMERGSEIHTFCCAGLRFDKSNLDPARQNSRLHLIPP